jgi:hypothetical protein
MTPDDRQHRRRINRNRPAKPRRKPRPNTKVTGERSEAAFLAVATYRNFGVAKPWGDSRRYDFILDNGEVLIRIQIKCTECLRADAYETRATYTKGNQHVPYTKKDIDFVAAHVVPLNLWYIIPVEVCTPAPMLRFYPHRKREDWMPLEEYREAWHLILPSQGVDENGRIELQACADDTADETTAEDFADANDEDYAGTDHVGADAFVRPARGASAGLGDNEGASNECGPGTPTRNLRTLFAQAVEHYRTQVRHTQPTTLNPNLAPFALPKVKILTRRQGQHILPNAPDK